MKIKELHITKFGNIRNFDVKAEDKMNYLYGLDDENRTAVMDFILVMFYGTVNNFREDIREKYLPLDGSDITGSMVFEYLGDDYLLERVFNAGRYKKDTITLTNKTKGTSEKLAYNVKPGEYLFRVSKEMFVRNSYVNYSDNLPKSAKNYNAAMQKLLSNIISTSSELISVSSVAKMLNSYCDEDFPGSLSSSMRSKRNEMAELEETLKSARNIENDKIAHQNHCNELYSKFNMQKRKFQKIKENLKLQDMITELESLNDCSENSELSFKAASENYNRLNQKLKKEKILEHREAFDRSCENYKRISKLRKELDAELQKKTNLSVDLGRYTPKGDNSALQNVITLQSSIENTEETIRTLHVQLDEKRNERNQLAEKLRAAKDKMEDADQALRRQEEMTRSKLAQAESQLHDSSYTVNTQAVNKSKNLILAIFLLAFLITLLIIFLTNIVAVVIIGIAIFSDLYAIISKLGKEKKVSKIARVDEVTLRERERKFRDLRTACSTERDNYVAKAAIARNQYDEIKRKDTSLKKQLASLENEIKSSEENLKQFIAGKEGSEKNISSPDPIFYQIRSEINEIERSAELHQQNIEELEKSVLSSLAPIRQFAEYSDAEEFIRQSIDILAEYDKLSERLSILGDKEKAGMVAAGNKIRIDQLNEQIKKLSGGKPVKKLTTDEYRSLQTMADSLEQENSRIRDEYIDAITRLKIKYNDSTCVANTEHRIHRLQREINRTDENLNSVKLAIESYNSTLEEIHDKYAPQVAHRTSEILSEITKGKYASVSVKGGKLVVRDKDKNIIAFEKLSSSACNIVYFALRLAVAEITCCDMDYPIILNDYYLRVSEAKVAELLKFLKKYSEKNQVIIFSPTNRISSVALNEQISIDDVNLSSLT
ncbi:hypothetical protein [Ruminococcus sp. HUN007]|uniref:ATP-binding protein n=1 Tax=Ruminococcus sp. HUN007 TaxID=1514668 RepID=UPI0005D191E1|nr:hypothetical protein [Ruminococcus sp. HUN007]